MKTRESSSNVGIELIDIVSSGWLLGQQVVDPTNLRRIPGSYINASFSVVMLFSVALGAIAYWLLQRGVRKDKNFLMAGLFTLGLAFMFAFAAVPSDLSSVIRFCFSILAIGGGMGFLVAREPVYAALGFVTAILSACGVMFMQHAYFIAAATMIVYAGATIIIFLFVLMFAQQSQLRPYDVLLTRPALAAVIATALILAITYSVSGEGEILPLKTDSTRPLSLAAPSASPNEDPPMPFVGMTAEQSEQFYPAKTAGLGRALYTDYLLAVELAGTVLLVATIGALALAEKPNKDAS